MPEFVLTLTCPDRPGIVHAVAAYLHLLGCNILDSQQFDDRLAGRFFMRVHVETVPGADTSYQALRGGFAAIASEFGSAATPSGSRWPARCAGTPSTACCCTAAAR
ncbi:MAG: ACT domain-containing protein [Streptosporangiaceae bacterium]|nr:ACT domain-containing protein [Streptosporangiaceae bacterium]